MMSFWMDLEKSALVLPEIVGVLLDRAAGLHGAIYFVRLDRFAAKLDALNDILLEEHCVKDFFLGDDAVIAALRLAYAGSAVGEEGFGSAPAVELDDAAL